MELNSEIKDYWEGESYIYSAGIQEELAGPHRQAWKDLISEYAPREGALKILDAGCGPGFFEIVLSELGHDVTGIDITENMIARARENVASENANAELMVMDCQELSFPDNTFDLVICRNITWTLADPKKAYHEWKRVLKPGGRIMVFDACWYLQLFDEELKAKYIANEEKVNEQFEIPKRGLVDPQRGDAIGNIAFMGNKHRPAWDLGYFIEMGFRKVFSEPNIMDRTCWGEREKLLHKYTPGFMVGAEK